MFQLIAKSVAAFSLALKQPVSSFCEIETSHDRCLVTKTGDYASVLRVDGMRSNVNRKDIESMAEAQRLDLTGTLEGKGHAIVGFFASDPELTARHIDLCNLNGCRNVAAELGANFDNILDERSRLWPRLMRWEVALYVLWTRKAVLTKEERKQMKEEQTEQAAQFNRVGDAQRFYVRSEVMSSRHMAFEERVISSLRNSGIGTTKLSAGDALVEAREALYRETAGSKWRASLLGDRPMPSMQEDDAKPHPEGVLWPSLRDQIFYANATTKGGQRVEMGEYEYAPVDMSKGPEEPKPFIELMSPLGKDKIPWRMSIIIEGGGKGAMMLKSAAAEFLGFFPNNAALRRAFDALRRKEEEGHLSVKLRVSFATWALIGDDQKLRRRASILTQRIEAWGNCKATSVSGDPLECAMGSIPALALGSTAAPHAALLGDTLAMLPGNRPGSPYESGSVLFRRPDGGLWPYDPSGGAMRPQVLDIFIAPPRSGKSVLANTINLGLVLSSACLGSKGAKIPLIGKADIGPSAKGFVRLVQEALGPEQAHQAIFVTMSFSREHEYNPLDLQVGCEAPLQIEKAFLQNWLALATLPIGESKPFEGMSQLISLVIDEVYKQCTEEAGGEPKRYRLNVEPSVDAMLQKRGIVLEHKDPYWRDVVNELIKVREFRIAEVAQRHAVPIMEDLISAVGSEHVQADFRKLKIADTDESLPVVFVRYIKAFIRDYPTLNAPTKLDFGPARIIVLDLAAVAPTGSERANRQTEMMYMMARHILARNFFLHPEYAVEVPVAVRAHHLERFQEITETIKRLDFDEWHRTARSPQVRAQAELDVREGPKHNIQLGFASQRLVDMGEGILSQATGRFILRAGDEEEMQEIVKRFGLNDACATIVRRKLLGPGSDGAPFLAVLNANGERYDQLLVNSLGPIELWAFSTTPSDTQLRERLISRLGGVEAGVRLALVFPKGSAQEEVDRRKRDRLKMGEMNNSAEEGVIDELCREIYEGTGIAMLALSRREVTPPPVAKQPVAIAAA